MSMLSFCIETYEIRYNLQEIYIDLYKVYELSVHGLYKFNVLQGFQLIFKNKNDYFLE